MLQIIFSLNTLWWLILLLYIPACFGLIIIVLLQKGKGQGLAGVLGMGGGMDTIFGPRSSKSLPQKITYASAAVFMTLALVMSILSGKVGRSAAPGLVTEAPDTALEALFDPSAVPADPVSVPLDAPFEDIETEATETPAPDEGVTVFEIDTEDAEPAEAVEVTAPSDDPEPAEAPETAGAPVEVYDAGADDAGSDSDSPTE